MNHPLRKLLLIAFLGLATLIASSGYAQPAHDECGCCTEPQQMMCAACKVCTTPGLLAAPVALVMASHPEAVATIPTFHSSLHTEDIWHPPKHPS